MDGVGRKIRFDEILAEFVAIALYRLLREQTGELIDVFA